MSPRLFPIALLALLLPLPAAHAAEKTVTTSIQAAVDAAADGDVVKIPAGTYREIVDVKKALTLDAAPGAVLVNPAGGEVKSATLTLSSADGATLRGLSVVSTVADAVRAGGKTTLVQRAQLITLAKGAAALSTTASAGQAARTVTIDSTVLSGPVALSAAYAPNTAIGGGIAVVARHATAVGNVVANSINAVKLGSQPITISFADSIVRGAQVAATTSTSPDATITTGDRRNDVKGDTADVGSLFVAANAFNYHLRADAPVIGRGQLTSGESTTDVDGDDRGSTTDLGADEFVNRAPTASLAAPARAVRQNLPATFDASGSADPESRVGGGIVAYHWDFGDGTTADTATPTTTHAFAEKRSYSVTVTVTDRQGATSAPSEAVAFEVIDGTPPTITVGAPSAKQRIAAYRTVKVRRGKGIVTKRKRRPVTFYGAAADDQALDGVVLALRKIAPTKDGQCRWFDGTRKLVTASCSAPVLLKASVINGGWSYELARGARIPRGPYRLVAASADASGLTSALQTIDFRLT